jgi:hypothetical protein
VRKREGERDTESEEEREREGSERREVFEKDDCEDFKGH